MKIGIIGGTGVYDPGILEGAKQVSVDTKFGKPSDKVTVGRLGGVDVCIIPRHGIGHRFNPSSVNYRANIWALKELGCEVVIGVSAVGSLKEEYRPGDLVFTDQFFDRTYKRETTFYDKGRVCHVGVAEPFCPEVRKVLAAKAKELGIPFHESGTCVVIEGPRFSTKAESRIYRSWDADIIGMTLCPEAALAREAEMCYASIALVTDYDVWKDHFVSSDEVVRVMKGNLEKVRKLLPKVIPAVDEKRSCACGSALKGSFLS